MVMLLNISRVCCGEVAIIYLFSEYLLENRHFNFVKLLCNLHVKILQNLGQFFSRVSIRVKGSL